MVGNVAGWSCRGPAIGSRAFYCHRNSLFLAWNSYSGEPTLNMPIVDHQLENDYYGTSPNAIAGSNLIRTPLLLHHIPRNPTSDMADAPKMGVRRRRLCLPSCWPHITMLWQDLTPGLPPTRHPCMPQHFSPTSRLPTPLHLIAIFPLAIIYLSPRARLGLSQPLLKTELLSTNHSIDTRKHPTQHPLAKYTKKPWFYPLLTLTKERSFVGCAQAPHRLAFCWCPPYIHSSNGLGCIVHMCVWRDIVTYKNMMTVVTWRVCMYNTQVRHHTRLVQTD